MRTESQLVLLKISKLEREKLSWQGNEKLWSEWEGGLESLKEVIQSSWNRKNKESSPARRERKIHFHWIKLLWLWALIMVLLLPVKYFTVVFAVVLGTGGAELFLFYLFFCLFTIFSLFPLASFRCYTGKLSFNSFYYREK